jgi:hypothetical protein
LLIEAWWLPMSQKRDMGNPFTCYWLRVLPGMTKWGG